MSDSPEVALRYLDNVEKQADLSEDRVLGSIRRTLIGKAVRIIERKTVFCMSAHSNERWREVVKSMAKEVYQRLENDKHAWAFLATSHQCELMGDFMRALQMEIASAALGRYPFERPGPTLIVGETGTGKSMAARISSVSGMRKNFVPMNLSAVSPGLLEGRMRGSKRGSYTNSVKDTKGWFEEANDGVLFLDELQAADLAFQTQLLDLLDPSTNAVEVAPVGDDANKKSWNVKVILAINEEIAPLIRQERLRKDILYRIRNIVRLDPLRKRLANDPKNHLLRVLLHMYRWRSAAPVALSDLKTMHLNLQIGLFPEFSPCAEKCLRDHVWEGNLREFERVANDLYWTLDMDKGNDNTIKAKDVEEAIFAFDINGGVVQPQSETTLEQRVLLDVQAVLCEENFVLKNAIKRLRRYGLGGYESLKAYLRENRELLDASVLAVPQIKKILAPKVVTLYGPADNDGSPGDVD